MHATAKRSPPRYSCGNRTIGGGKCYSGRQYQKYFTPDYPQFAERPSSSAAATAVTSCPGKSMPVAAVRCSALFGTRVVPVKTAPEALSGQRRAHHALTARAPVDKRLRSVL